MDELLRIYPTPPESVPLVGAYLLQNLRQHAVEADEVTIYANFITSIDGRIAVPDPKGRGLVVPRQTANERDWRLFQELAAQADLVISSGRYLREWEQGVAQEILQVDDPRFNDLRAWREYQGLPPQPDLAIISASLRFPIPEALTAGGRKVVVFTSGKPDPQRVAEITRKAGQVYVVGEEGVDGARMAGVMKELGYRTVYSAAGPKVLHLLLKGKVLKRLYLTYANRILGGDPYASIVDGPRFEPAVDFRIASIYLDPQALDGLGQLFVSYDCAQS